MIEFSCFIFFWYSNSFFQSIIYYNFDKQKEIQFQKREGRTNFLWTTLLWFGSIQHIATELILINIIMSQTIQLICDVSFNLLMSPIEFDFHIRNSAKYCNLDEKLKLMIEISQFCSRHFKFWTHSSLRPLKSHSKRSHLEPRSVFYPEGNVLVF